MNEYNYSATETNGIQAEASAHSLKKVLKTRDLVIFGMVFMAPVSAQTLFGELTQLSKGHAVLSYVVGLVAMIFTAFCYGKMAGAFPKAGSTYSYTSQAIHPQLGFMAGWAILLDYLLIPMLLYKLSAVFLMELIPSVPLWIVLLIFVVPVTLSNYFGARVTSRVNMYMMLLMFFSLALFIGFAVKSIISSGGISSLFSLQGIYNRDTFSMNSLVTGASIAVLSYLGFDAVTTMSEDSKVTGKMVGRAAILSLLISSFFYICQVYFATLAAPDFTSFASQETAFFEIATAVGGSPLATICTLIIAVSGISTALAGQASASRILFSMGSDKMLPDFFARLHPKYQTPVNSIASLAIVGYIGAVFIPLSVLFQLIVIGALFGFVCVNLSVVKEFYFRRKERQGWQFITNLLFPLLGLSVCVYIFFGISPIGKTIGFIWLSAGFCLLMYTLKFLKREISIFENL
ncbi:APC family permease [Bacillus sp. PK3_68]|uniref:APC family permease n=1 Tax=Bacillus sp. PK3_68 TaxID=2027408 RepID=UPI000E758A8E|nr:APC family permease [Bacillus sp. PK3_68]RJS59935.1 amino acid permease [Bacillus sp. PK3_68]